MSGVVLCIGGLDSSGGAGVLRDSATVHALGGTARVAVTAVTAQSDHAVTAVHAVPPKVVTEQIDIAGPVSAVKIGMLGTVGIVEAVAATLPRAPCVLDPVLMSSSGHMLLDDPGVTALLERLLPKVDLLTPNVPELAALARRLGVPEGDHGACVERLLQRGCGAVLVKGGHAQGTASVDHLYRRDIPVVAFTAPRIDATLRGTGCRLASAIAVHIAQGASLVDAITAAKHHVHGELVLARGVATQPRS
ncbi:MAG: hydroxymethylpyrimidine/phosphomethylpyrimidine kinase [Alphaproteobacteria bacterium]|nr:hydroxymethylpyrimidine/phosphomethylpyrimidine kinase [Alphaproteobacteria bacterium]MBU1573892.1 hydroxymethylpyrimidine/phosphomethylpyrimidine kinase [Alphaproteobacteria bacterium]MBU1827944.1 hydroxymethylpyrimidine/phosphomethylpyrimidine kinase [Alphaproteobacteria bacterium]MBU2077391.1 hydroxymethylpyrimidine/phosphomethylpyrimidine kinase [Alphaproteobacteria bacterium]MBU2160788.1 hydroxymethylpyrimidine/phosphomethylpyrimidine kinase [Alphaproteobacteria bacterium]